MKIGKLMYQEMEADLLEVASRFESKSGPGALQRQYEAHKINPFVKDADKRLRWDLLWASRFETVRLYALGYNDDHIDTALRKILKAVKNAYFTDKAPS